MRRNKKVIFFIAGLLTTGFSYGIAVYNGEKSAQAIIASLVMALGSILMGVGAIMHSKDKPKSSAKRVIFKLLGIFWITVALLSTLITGLYNLC